MIVSKGRFLKRVIVFVEADKDEDVESNTGSGRGIANKPDESDMERNDAMLLEEMTSHGIGTFQPDIMMQNLTQRYSHAEKLYGKKLISLATGYDSEYVKRNIRIPEFHKELEKRLKAKEKELGNKGLIEEGSLTDKAFVLATQVMLTEEIERMYKTSFNDSRGLERSDRGERESVKPYNNEKYHDIALRNTIRMSIKRSHSGINKEDIRAYQNISRPSREIVLAVDMSGSMKGEKIGKARRAFAALLAHSMSRQDDTGLLLFNTGRIAGHNVKTQREVMLRSLISNSPHGKTSLGVAIMESIKLFSADSASKHIMLVTDANPTQGANPYKHTIEAASMAKENNITVSFIAINPDKKSEEFATRIVEMTRGRFYKAHENSLGHIMLEDYENAS
ncbi:MAG: vWA domain-containing protein [Candidatus Woesearchaeota archaeon]